MKMLTLAFLLAATTAAAEPAVNLSKQQLGNAGDPAQTTTVGSQAATPVGDGMFHTPQYMEGFPTAATIWPRAVTVDCDKAADGTLNCDGFHWEPKFGRGEYLFVVPHVRVPAAPVVVVQEKIVEKKVLVEVPVKAPRE